MGCDYATFLLKETSDYFTRRESNVCFGMLDLSKAFDKINHYCLFKKLIERKIPYLILCLIVNWYDDITTVVSWMNHASLPVRLHSGVRQGGILSPFLFAVYVDDLLHLLSASKIGCFINGYCLNSIMYADDLILIALSVADLRKLLNICIAFFDKVDMPINYSKSKCMRVGTRFKHVCAPVVINNFALEWTKSMKFLGTVFEANNHLRLNSTERRKKFMSSFNAIYGRIGKIDNISILIFLLGTICTPTLLYGIEIFSEDKTEKNKMQHTFERAGMKIFSTFDKNVLANCLFYSGILPLNFQCELKRLLFLKRIFECKNNALRQILNCFSANDDLFVKYALTKYDSISTIKNKVFDAFQMLLQL